MTAAKKGRPLFAQMLKGLRRGDASGVIIHKIDRSARNLRDWADLGELIDAGVSVHFANESLDLLSRGGRLSADIQAVVAADYIRNLREETLKGINGRLKQGVYPFGAPLGYLNMGAGRPKDIDPERGPLVRDAFRLYASGYNLDSLVAELHRRGLRNRRGRTVSRNSLSAILNNPFYAGLIRLKTRTETYRGRHTSLIEMALFKQVEARLRGKFRARKWIHDFTFRGLFKCSLCDRHLTGELQKGHIYYRCQTSDCPTRTFREEVLEAALLQSWPPIAVSDESKAGLLRQLEFVEEENGQGKQERRAHLQATIGGIKARLARITDACVDGVIDKSTFEERKRTLLEEQRSLEDSLDSQTDAIVDIKQFIMERLELASSAQQSYRLGTIASRREMVLLLTSNRTVARKDVSIEPSFPLHRIAERHENLQSGPNQAATRTFAEIARSLWNWARAELEKRSEMELSMNQAARVRVTDTPHDV